jgi:hypothetical protein
MFEELRESFREVLLVDMSADRRDKLQKGNPTTTIFSCHTGGRVGDGFLPGDAVSSSPDEFELVMKRVDLIIFGKNLAVDKLRTLIWRFAQNDAILLFAVEAGSISPEDLAQTGAVDARVFSLHRLPGTLVVGYAADPDFGTRVYAKLLSGFLAPLGPVVTGARVVVDGQFTNPGVAGNWFLVARPGVSVPMSACSGDTKLVAVVLSTSDIKSLASSVFCGCAALAGVSFPSQLERIGLRCFDGCVALLEVDLSSTRLTELESMTFSGSGLTRVSLPATLRKCCISAFRSTPLRILDFNMCARLMTIARLGTLEVAELRLPRANLAELTRALLPGSRVEVLVADIDEYEASQVQDRLEEWGIDRLLIVSRRLEAPIEWRARSKPELECVTNPESLVARSAVFATGWRAFRPDECVFIGSIDMSELHELPQGATLANCPWLETAILPNGLRVLPRGFFRLCWRLSHIGTSACTALDRLCPSACECCRSLSRFDFPRSSREVEDAFCFTAIEEVDLSDTFAESAGFQNMTLVERLILPRGCVLEYIIGLPALRILTFGGAGDEEHFSIGSQISEVRFESFLAPRKEAAGLKRARVHGEVTAVFTRESNSSYPP